MQDLIDFARDNNEKNETLKVISLLTLAHIVEQIDVETGIQ